MILLELKDISFWWRYFFQKSNFGHWKQIENCADASQVWNKVDFLKSGFFTLLLFSGIARGIAVDEDTLIGDTIQYRKNYASRRLSRSVLHVLARTMDTEIQPPNHIGYCKVAILSYAVSPNFTPKSHKDLVMMLIDHETVGSVGTQHISTPVDFYLPSIKYLPLHFQMKEI